RSIRPQTRSLSVVSTSVGAGASRSCRAGLMHVLKMLDVRRLSGGGSILVVRLSLIASNLVRQLFQRFLGLGTDAFPSAEDLIPIHCDLPSSDLIDVLRYFPD